MKNKLKSFFTKYWKYLAVSTACELNLFDFLKVPKTAKQVSDELSLYERTLFHLLEALVHMNCP